MWIELPPLGIALVNVLAIPAIHLLVSWGATRLPASFFRPQGVLFRVRGWEQRGGHERWFRVRGWKHLLPDAAPWFRGFSKAALKSTDPDYLRAFAVETCRGELAHWVQIAALQVCLLWTPWPAGWVIVAYSLLSNAPCIVNLRHTRMRLERVLRRPGGSPRGA